MVLTTHPGCNYSQHPGSRPACLVQHRPAAALGEPVARHRPLECLESSYLGVQGRFRMVARNVEGGYDLSLGWS